MDTDFWAAPIGSKIIGQIGIKIGGNQENQENQSICGLIYIKLSIKFKTRAFNRAALHTLVSII
jgi:hypothetical protein